MIFTQSQFSLVQLLSRVPTLCNPMNLADQLSIIKQMSRQVSRCSAGVHQADEQAGVARLSWRLSSRWAGRCSAAQLASIKQMNRQVSRGSAGDYKTDDRQVSRSSAGDNQADKQAGVARLSWRVSSIYYAICISTNCMSFSLQISEHADFHIITSEITDKLI